MSDRRRNIFVLLTVVGLIAASLAVIFTKETKLGLDLQGGVQLVFQGKPTKQTEVTPESLDRAVDIVGTTAQLYFYDWEPNVLDEDCRTNPDSVNGGQTAVSGLYNAVKRASECQPERDANNTTSGSSFYAFDKDSNQPLLEGI